MTDKILLAKQSYKEAFDEGLVGKLELLGLVTGASKLDQLMEARNKPVPAPFSPEAIIEVTNKLKKQAKELGAIYVFGIEYKGFGVPKAYETPGATIVYGDAYKLKEEK